MNMAAMSGHDLDLVERMWTRPVASEDLYQLIKNPVYFVQSVAGKKLGNLQLNPIVTIEFQYPCAQAGLNEEPYGEVVVQGIVDTNHINVRILRTAPVSDDSLKALEPLTFDPDHPVHLLLRTRENLAFAHFHIEADSDTAGRNAFSAAVHPVCYIKRVQEQIDRLLSSGQIGESQNIVSDENNNLINVRSLTVAPRVPCVFNVQFDISTMAVGGCNCAIGTYTTTNDAYDLCFDTTCCSVYTPVPV